MKLKLEFTGRDDPFEGDRTLHLKTIPEGAQITGARINAAPQQCAVPITFSNGTGSWGATKESGTLPDPATNNPRWTAVDLHARRRISHIRARFQANILPTDPNVAVQVNVGGLWTRLAADGSISSEGDTDTFQLRLSTTSATFNLPPTTIQGVKLQHASTAIAISQLTVTSHPSNLSVRLGQGVPFWVKPGELVTQETSPEFADVLQAFLAEAELVNGFYAIPLVLHSDSIACLDLTIEIDYVLEQRVLSAGVSDAKLPFTYSGEADTEAKLLQIEVPVGARVVPGKTNGRVEGAFEPSRVVFGPLGAVQSVANVPILTNQSQAQPIMLDQDVAATAVDLFLSAETLTAELDVLLLEDTDGKPGSTPIFSPPAPLVLERDVDGNSSWASVALPREVQFVAGERVWLVLQVRRGKVSWQVNPTTQSVGLQFTDNGGLSWRVTAVPETTDPLAALFRLRHTPSRFQMPIELQVGTSDDAQRISLERFAPMGRVDFSLDFDDVAKAINKYMESSGPTACPEGEHLVNGNFSEWTAVGNTLGNLQPVELSAQPVPSTLAVVPDGQQILIGTTNGQILFMDLPCHTTDNATTIDLSTSRVNHIIVNQKGARAYIIAPSSDITTASLPALYVVNVEDRQRIGSFISLLNWPTYLALTPDGNRLYLTSFDSDSGGQVWAIDTDLLEQTLLNTTENINISDVLINDNLPDINFGLGSAVRPSGLAISPDGHHLYVPVNDETGTSAQNLLHVYAINTHQEIAPPIEIGPEPRGIAITPDGNIAVLADADDNSVSLIDTSQHTVIGNPLALPGTASSSANTFSTIVVSPDSQRAFVAITNNEDISVIDLPRRTIIDSIELDEDAFDLRAVITPDGSRLYLIHEHYEGADSLAYIPIGVSFPAEWTITSGSVNPFCYDDPFHQLVILGANSISGEFIDTPSSISQVVPVAANCPYDFSFWGRTVLTEATAEVIWLGDQCGEVSIDWVPVELIEIEPGTAPEIILHRARLKAPAGAKQAEVRFTSVGGGYTIIDNVSLEATQEAVINNDLRIVQESDQGWNISPPNVTGLSFSVHEDELHLENNGIQQITFSQTIPVLANRPFTLSFQGRPVKVAPSQLPSYLELQWIDPAGMLLTADIINLEIDAAHGDQLVVGGQVPSDAAEAEIRLVVPGRTTLAVARISFKPLEIVTIPINFIAHAPGEMTVSDFRVAFETAVATKPPIPESGLCTPTPPGREPGSQANDCCFCPCCGGENHLQNAQPTITESNRPATRGDCPDCGTELVQPGGQIPTSRSMSRPSSINRPIIRINRANVRLPATSTTINRMRTSQIPPPISPMENDIAALLPMTPSEWAVLAGVSSELIVPALTDIKGIGPVLDKKLNQLGLGSLDALAAADPDEIATNVRGISSTQATNIVSAAKVHLTNADAKQAPLVSCVMPTYNRRIFVPQAIEFFLRQDYPHRELIIVDDSTDSIIDLVPQDERIRYIYLEEKRTLGAKNNIGCEIATGTIVARWEDDVWMDYWRLSYQVAALLKHQADICGPNHFLHYDIINQEAWHSIRPPGERPWILGSAICFTKAYWDRNPFRDMNLGDEIKFIRSDPAAKIITLQANTYLIDIIHGGNMSPKNTASKRWHDYPVEEIQSLMGSDWQFYQMLAQKLKV